MFDQYLKAKEERREAIKHKELIALSNMTGCGYATLGPRGTDWIIDGRSTVCADDTGRYVQRATLNHNSGLYQYLQQVGVNRWYGRVQVGSMRCLAAVWYRGNGKGAMLTLPSYYTATAAYETFAATNIFSPSTDGIIGNDGVDLDHGVELDHSVDLDHILDTNLPKWIKMSSKDKKRMQEATVACDLVKGMIHDLNLDNDATIGANMTRATFFQRTTGYNVSIITSMERVQRPGGALFIDRSGRKFDMGSKWLSNFSTLREVDGAFHHISGGGVDMRTVEALNRGRIFQAGDIWMRTAKRDGVNYTEYLGGFDNGAFIISRMM